MSQIFGALSRAEAFTVMQDDHIKEMTRLSPNRTLLEHAHFMSNLYRREELIPSSRTTNVLKCYWVQLARKLGGEIRSAPAHLPLFDEAVAASAYFQHLVESLDLDINSCPDCWGVPATTWVDVKPACNMIITQMEGRVLLHTPDILAVHPHDQRYVLALDGRKIPKIEPFQREAVIAVACEPPVICVEQVA